MMMVSGMKVIPKITLTAGSACDQVQMLQQVCLLSFTILSFWNSLQTIYLPHNICIKVAFHT
uniref:Uncharacterized protein n=1 Tax=Helianthus annuus TaxID=4232 RepID=A0A251TJZ4_HELAN